TTRTLWPILKFYPHVFTPNRLTIIYITPHLYKCQHVYTKKKKFKTSSLYHFFLYLLPLLFFLTLSAFPFILFLFSSVKESSLFIHSICPSFNSICNQSPSFIEVLISFLSITNSFFISSTIITAFPSSILSIYPIVLLTLCCHLSLFIYFNIVRISICCNNNISIIFCCIHIHIVIFKRI